MKILAIILYTSIVFFYLFVVYVAIKTLKKVKLRDLFYSELEEEEDEE